jgi:hypothetical protein
MRSDHLNKHLKIHNQNQQLANQLQSTLNQTKKSAVQNQLDIQQLQHQQYMNELKEQTQNKLEN